jgi:molybdenum cofactor cytidylyltransferase
LHVHGKLHLILLASGGSARYGANKLLIPIDGKPMFRHIFDLLVRYREENPEKTDLTVVSRYDEILDAARKAWCIAVRNDRTVEGISLSLRMGLEEALRSGAEDASGGDCAVFFTADQPYLRYETLRDFLERAALSDKGIVSASHDDTPGNPVSFDRKYFAELMELTGDAGGRQTARRHPEDTEWFEMRLQELADIDTPCGIGDSDRKNRGDEYER